MKIEQILREEIYEVLENSSNIWIKTLRRNLKIFSNRTNSNSSFPEPFPLGPNKVVWDVREIEKYINEQKKHRGFLGYKPIRLVHNVNKTQ